MNTITAVKKMNGPMLLLDTDSVHTLEKPEDIQANQGTAHKLKRVCPIEHRYPSHGPAAGQVWNIFICAPQLQDEAVTVTVLERHLYTTQTFIPIGRASNEPYLVVVASNKRQDGRDVPDLETVQVVLCTSQAVTYAINQWHAPMIALRQETQFCVTNAENGTADDCEEHLLAEPLRIVLGALQV